MGAILKYILFCGLVAAGATAAMVSGYPKMVVATLAIWTVAGGAIVTVLYRSLKRLR